MNSNRFSDLLAKICYGLADYSEIYSEDRAGLHILFEDRKVEPITYHSEKGVGLRLFFGEEVNYIFTNEPENLYPLSKNILLTKKQENKVKANSSVINPAVLQSKNHQIKILPETIRIDTKIKLVTQLDKIIREKSNEIQQVSINYNERKKKIVLVNSDGQKVEEERNYLSFSVNVVAKRNNLIQTAYDVIGGLTGWELVEDNNVLNLAEKVVIRVLAKLSAPAAPVGEMPVVIASSAGGTMIHEAIGHSLEADTIQKGISPQYLGKIGKIVANEKISVCDDPTVPNKYGSYFFDDEGISARKTILVENGILKNYLYDRYTSRKDNCESTGNGRRESYHLKPIPRMSNTYILPGNDSPEQILSSVENGLLVKKMGGGQVNTATGDFVFEIEEGYLIKNGQVGSLVRGATLLGNGPEVLKSIDMVSNDLGWGIGVCGKDGQGVPVSDAQPTLRIPKLVVGGTEKM